MYYPSVSWLSLSFKSVFLKLINVSGIGGKMAIAILSAMPVANLIEAIVTENSKYSFLI